MLIFGKVKAYKIMVPNCWATLYAPTATKKEDVVTKRLCTLSTFSQSLMTSFSVSKVVDDILD